MAKFYSFYSGEDAIFSQAVRKLQLPESEGNTNFSQVVRKLEPSGFPTVLGMIPWGHHAEIFYHAHSTYTDNLIQKVEHHLEVLSEGEKEG